MAARLTRKPIVAAAILVTVALVGSGGGARQTITVRSGAERVVTPGD